MSVRWFRYVPWSRWTLWARLGWVFVGDLGPPHGFYAGLWEWRGEGEPREPEDGMR